MSSCIAEVSHKIITLTDKRGGKSKFVLNNKDQKPVSKIEIDGCYIKEGKKCDFILSTEDIDYLVELKGEDIRSGIEQIESTINKFYPSSTRNSKEKKSYIVATKTNPSTRSAINMAKLKFKKYKATLEVKNIICEVSL